MNTTRIHYTRNFLTKVIFKVDFPKVLELGVGKGPAEFQNKIKDSYPILEEKPGKFFELAIPGAPKEEAKLIQEEIVRWDFFDKERTKKVVVTPEFVSLEYSKYNSFDEFQTGIEDGIRPFFDIYTVIKVAKRINMRYINQIVIPSGDPLDWSNLINPSMVSVVRDFVPEEHKGNIKRHMQQLILKEKVGDLQFQFGQFNSEFPNPIARKEFVLDYDCVLREEIEVHEVFDKVKESHDIIEFWFEKSIEDGLRNLMKGGV